MAEKILKFSISETTGRTFEIPYSKALEIIKNYSSEAEPNTWSEIEIAEELYMGYIDEISSYEKDNSYYESYVSEAEVD